MRVYLRDGSAQTIVSAATPRHKLQIKLSTSPSHSILTPGRPVLALTLQRQAPGRVATGVPIFKSLVGLYTGKSRRKWDSNPGSSAPEADALTPRPARQGRSSTRWQGDLTKKEGSASKRKSLHRRQWKALMKDCMLQWMDKAWVKLYSLKAFKYTL